MNEAMGEIANVTEYDVKPEHREDFEALLRDHAERTLRVEPGCLRFDILLPRDASAEKNPTRILLYELYRDEAEYRAHTDSDRLANFREAYKDMLADRRIMLVDVT
ncbi:MAG: antibiotic biosynthesis monooxygenase family protein [Rhodospirillales bacterium]|jgi:quinol monooxygenase YgiN|nr:antibiotic biosynthesis monooxygenase family protein [Rhodospirillales bacterium]HJO97242.1 antibiotic biosynthesis monooxygenase family protein [Rhodospirillales bacterium]